MSSTCYNVLKVYGQIIILDVNYRAKLNLSSRKDQYQKWFIKIALVRVSCTVFNELIAFRPALRQNSVSV